MFSAAGEERLIRRNNIGERIFRLSRRRNAEILCVLQIYATKRNGKESVKVLRRVRRSSPLGLNPVMMARHNRY